MIGGEISRIANNYVMYANGLSVRMSVANFR